METSDATRVHDLLCVGMSFIDVNFSGLPAGGPILGQELWTPHFTVGPGGVANFAIAAARLGADVVMASPVADDPIGAMIIDQCLAEGIDCSPCIVVDGWRQNVTAAISYDGDRALVTGGVPAPAAVHDVLTDQLPAARVSIAHLTGAASLWLADSAAQGTKVVGQVGWDQSGQWDLDALTGLNHCWAFIPNEDEALAYARTTDIRTAAETLASRIPVVVVTRGAQGAVALDAATGEWVEVAGLPAHLVDATGAGDTFAAAFSYLAGRGAGLAACVTAGVLASGLAVQGPGGALSAPTAVEVLAALDHVGSTARDEVVALLQPSDTRRVPQPPSSRVPRRHLTDKENDS